VSSDGTLDPNARLRQARRPDGSIAEGAPEWVAPPRARVSAVARLKEELPEERTVVGTRQDAEIAAHSIIDAWLKKRILSC
jgi:hypothetical protein